jgi:hypothetical protein
MLKVRLEMEMKMRSGVMRSQEILTDRAHQAGVLRLPTWITRIGAV